MRSARGCVHSRRSVLLPKFALKPIVILFVACLLVSQVSAQQVPTLVMTSAGRVHDLPSASTHDVSVNLQAIVTYYDPPENILFVQDRTGGVFVNVPKPVAAAAGDLVSVQGSVKYGFRAGVASDVRMQVLGKGYKLAPEDAGYSTLASGSLDCRLVRVSGVVQDAVVERHPESQSETLHMDLALDRGEVEVYVHDHQGLDPMSLLGRKIILTAVAGGSFNAKQQMNGVVLYSRSNKDVLLLKQGQQPYMTLPLSTSDEVFPKLSVRDFSPRTRLRGTVIYYAPGESAVLQQGSGKSVYVKTRQTSGISVGDVVEAYGFPDNRNYSPSLRDAILLNLHERQQVTPRLVQYQEALSGVYADRLITVQGRVLSQLRSAEANSIVLEVDGHVVRGTLQDPWNVPFLIPGSIIRMSGVCRIGTGGPWKEPVIFSLSVRNASDLKLIHNPPWWNVRHLAELLGSLLWLSLLIMLWAIILRRRVVRQAARIKRSMQIAEKRSFILKQMSLNPPLKEMLGFVATAAELLLQDSICHVEMGSEATTESTGDRLRIFHFPLLQTGKQIGTFSIYNLNVGSVSCEDEVTSMLQEVIPLVINSNVLHERLLHQSIHDPLTNLPNRRFCEEELDRLIAGAREDGTCVAVIYVDVNKFKTVNDRFGHKVGDLYLQAISGRLSAELRRDCTVARVGGDEFVVLLPDCCKEQAARMITRLEACFARPFALASTLVIGSASFGMAIFPLDGNTRELLEQRADADMYAAKYHKGESFSKSAHHATSTLS